MIVFFLLNSTFDQKNRFEINWGLPLNSDVFDTFEFLFTFFKLVAGFHIVLKIGNIHLKDQLFSTERDIKVSSG